MKNQTESIPSGMVESFSENQISSATFDHNGTKYTYAPGMDYIEFLEKFPAHKRITAMLSSSGSSWESGAFIFYTADCMDPPVYVQFGSSFEDAYESFLDNDPSLVIPESDYADYGIDPDGSGESLTCNFNSTGQPVDTDNLQGFGPLKIVSVTFA